MGILSCNPLIIGIGFLLVEPTQFRCKNHLTGIWEACHKDQVCNEFGGDRSLYYAVTEAPDFIYNWTLKFDLICTPKMSIGCIGLAYFLGVTLASVAIIPMSDNYGKKDVFCLFLLLSFIGQVAIAFWADGLLKALLCMFIIGLSWPGKRVVGLSYILDFFAEKYRNNKIMWLNILDFPSLLILSLSYQYLYRTWLTQ